MLPKVHAISLCFTSVSDLANSNPIQVPVGLSSALGIAGIPFFSLSFVFPVSDVFSNLLSTSHSVASEHSASTSLL